MIVNSCKDCEDRKVGCHSTCEKYINYRKEWDDIKKKMNDENFKDVAISESVGRYYNELRKKAGKKVRISGRKF